MKSSPAVSACLTSAASAVIWICVVATGVVENSGGAWSQNIRAVFFRNRSHTLMEKWTVDVTLPEWSLCVWEFIYTWNSLWVIYCVVITCRPISDKTEEESITCSVNAFPPLFHCLWGFVGLSHLAWFFFWDREVLVGSVFFQVFVVAACIGCLYISHVSVDRNGALLQAFHPWDLWVCRTLVQNGIAMLCSWCGILFLINMAAVLTYEGGIPSYFTSIGVLIAIGLFLLIWFILETFVLDRWVRYTFSIYAVIAWASLSMLLRHFQPWSHVTIATLSILATSLLILIIRVPLVVWKSFSYPLYITHTLPHVIDKTLPEVPVQRQERVISTIL